MASGSKALQQIKKKKWVQIIAPRTLNETVIGETHISEFSDAVGKEVSVSLMTLTGEPQKQNITLSFKMIGSKNGALTTEFIGYKLTPAAIRKSMRRGKKKIEDSFKAVTQDNVKVVVKPLLVTKNKTKSSVSANIRKTMRGHIAKFVGASKFDGLILDLISQKFQRALSDALRKIYPLSSCEIKYFCIVKETREGKAEVVAETPVVEEAKAEMPTVQPVVA